MGMFIFMMCLVGIGLALVRRYSQAVPAGPAVRGDAPERLLRWAAGLLSARREEWGQAMLGELGHIDGRGRRWRFAAGCAGAALLLPPWGRAAAAVWAMVVAAAGAAGVYVSVALRYRLGAGDWVFAVIALMFLVSFTLAAATLLRRPGIALPGLLGGLLVALTWLALSGFTFYGVTAPMTAPWSPLIAEVAVPVLVGVAWHAVGRQRRRRPAHRTAGRHQRRPGPVPVRDHRGRGARRRRAARDSGLDRQREHQRPARQHRDPQAGGSPAGDRGGRLGRRRSHRPPAPGPGRQRGFRAAHGGRPGGWGER